MIPIFRAKKIDSDEYIFGDLFDGKYIITKSTFNQFIEESINHIKNDVLTKVCINNKCKEDHILLEKMLSKLLVNERFEHIYEIDTSTLSIHFPDMLDIRGNKIFASLQKDGKGGDAMQDDDYYGIAKYKDSRFIVEYENVEECLFEGNFQAIGIQE